MVQQGRDLSEGDDGALHAHEDMAQDANVLADAEVDLAQGIESAHLHRAHAVLQVVEQGEGPEDEHHRVGDALDPMGDPRRVIHRISGVPVRGHKHFVLRLDAFLESRTLLGVVAGQVPPVGDDPRARLEPRALEVLPGDHRDPEQLAPEEHTGQARWNDDQDADNEAHAPEGRLLRRSRVRLRLQVRPEHQDDHQKDGQRQADDTLRKHKNLEVGFPGDHVRVVDGAVQPAGVRGEPML
mmetsp:Transcript_35077/g.101378  ORF Transcript_35077/g.101378 Transcript_35077/m.101378 type:complete len:240 (-) Transcript_35077:1430-2149(-)